MKNLNNYYYFSYVKKEKKKYKPQKTFPKDKVTRCVRRHFSLHCTSSGNLTASSSEHSQ